MHFARTLFLLLFVLYCPVVLAAPQQQSTYVGSKSCGQCHEKQYKTFSTYAKKAHSYKSVTILASKVTPEELKECYGCHTTGYGKPGGFVSLEKTPELANTSCEVCHGPGSAHAESGDPKLIVRKPAMESCQTCHNADRVKSFGFKPMKFAGAH